MTKNQNVPGTGTGPKGQDQKSGDLKKDSNISHKPETGEQKKEGEKVKENGSKKRETETPVAEKEEPETSEDW